MEKPAGLAVEKDYATYRAVGEMRFEDVIGLASRAVAYCRDQGIERILLDGRGLTGFGPLDLAGHFRVGDELARAGRAVVKVAILVRPEFRNPDRLGVTVARNRGLFANAFDSEDEAVAWLKDPNAT